MRRATVHDVALAANASLATVDRVLNGRPGVSAAMADRVRGAAERLSYRRDMVAASLATSRSYRFGFVLPPASTSTFFASLHAAVERHAATLAGERVFVSRCTYRAFSEAELVECLDEMTEEDHSGLAVVAVEGPRVREAVNRLADRGTPVVTLVADVLRTRRLHYVGIDNNAAGRTAGALLGRFVGRAEATVAVVLGSPAMRDHVERQLGFCQVMARDFPRFRLLPPLVGGDDADLTGDLLRDLLRREPHLAGLYNIGGGNRGVIRALEESGRAHEVVAVAHELTPGARAALLSGTYDAVLHQDPAEEVERCLRVLRAASDARPAATPPLPTPVQAPVPTHIFLRDNLP